MRILYVIDFDGPGAGGLERNVFALAHSMRRHDHPVAIATQHRLGTARTDVVDDVDVIRLPGLARFLPALHSDPNRPFPPPAPDPILRRGLAHLITQWQPDIIHANGWNAMTVTSLRRSRRPGIVVGLHDYAAVCLTRSLTHHGTPCAGPGRADRVRCAIAEFGAARGSVLAAAHTLGLRSLRTADLFIANSNYVADISRRSLGAAARIEVVPPFSRTITAAARPGWLPADNNYLLYVGDLEPHKGLPVLLRAHATLQPPPTLVVVGQLRNQRPDHTNPSASVIFAGPRPHDEVLAAMAGARALVVPSLWPEPFGLVAVEAMRAGTPVVATTVGGLADLIQNGHTGLTVPPNDAPALGAALTRILTDPARTDRWGQSAQRHAHEQFNPDQLSGRITELYRQTVHRHAPAPPGKRALIS